MTDNELLKARVARISSEEHLLEVIEKYAAKWHQLEDIKKSPGDTAFTSGRQVGYVEVISALLGVEHGQIGNMLRSGQL